MQDVEGGREGEALFCSAAVGRQALGDCQGGWGEEGEGEEKGMQPLPGTLLKTPYFRAVAS